MLRWLLPDDGDRQRRAPSFYTAVLAHLAPVATILTTEAHDGVALWQQPNTQRPGFAAEMLYSLRMLAALRAGARRGLRLVAAVEAAHPRTQHWYLSILGIEPERQGRGFGSQLMHPILQHCDREGIAAYLESSKEANIPFYRKLGFEVTGEIRIADGPTLWPMARTPRPSVAAVGRGHGFSPPLQRL